MNDFQFELHRRQWHNLFDLFCLSTPGDAPDKCAVIRMVTHCPEEETSIGIARARYLYTQGQ